jgi:predicted GNAT family acetyltransferase
MSVVRLDDPAAFLEAAGALLLADEARHNLMLGIAATAHQDRGLYPEYVAWIVFEHDEPVAAAMRTAPHNLALAAPRSEAALELLVAAIDDDPPGVVGAQPEVDQFAVAWSARRGVTPELTFAQGIYALERVLPVPPAAGRMRRQEPRDTELLVDWLRAFEAEALHSLGDGEDRARRIVESRLNTDRAGLMLWDDGDVVSMAGFSGETPNGIRIGPVYTPPELRGRGYATALVAELSAQLLAEGRRFCFLYTDLANAASNAIYERIGYVRVCESAEIAFESPS